MEAAFVGTTALCLDPILHELGLMPPEPTRHPAPDNSSHGTSGARNATPVRDPSDPVALANTVPQFTVG